MAVRSTDSNRSSVTIECWRAGIGVVERHVVVGQGAGSCLGDVRSDRAMACCTTAEPRGRMALLSGVARLLPAGRCAAPADVRTVRALCAIRLAGYLRDPCGRAQASRCRASRRTVDRKIAGSPALWHAISHFACQRWHESSSGDLRARTKARASGSWTRWNATLLLADTKESPP